MWFETLPSAVIITVLMTVPGMTLWGLNKSLCGNAYRRNTDDIWHRHLYVRDRIVDPNGNAYAVHGLEAIPDN